MKDAPTDTYIELIYSKGSKLNKIENLDDRKTIALKEANLDALPKGKEFEAKVIKFLSDQHSNKFSLLITKQELLWEMIQLLREPISYEQEKDISSWVKSKKDIDDLCDRLEASCSKLYEEIYTKELKEQAQEQIKILRPEERLQKK